jgi:ArsR family transcriptional regulator
MTRDQLLVCVNDEMRARFGDVPIVPAHVLEEAARRFALLSVPTRLRILSTLHDLGECTVGELADATGLALPNVSQHLSRLSTGGLVRGRRDGKAVRYRVADASIEELCSIVCAGVQERARVLSG